MELSGWGRGRRLIALFMLMVTVMLLGRGERSVAQLPGPGEGAPVSARTESWWDGFSGAGDFESPPVDLCEYGGRLHALGNFGHLPYAAAGSIGSLFENQWIPLAGPNPLVSNQAAYVAEECNGKLWVGGRDFWLLSAAAATPLGSLASWNGSHWQGFYLFHGPVYALAGFGGSLAVGGDFVSGTLTRIGRFDGSTWTPLGAGLNDRVNALTEYSGSLIAGGYFTASGSQPLSRIGRWDGSAWQPLALGFDDRVKALLVHQGTLIAGGAFTLSGTQGLDRVARWTGTAWVPMGAGFDAEVTELVDWNGELIAAGLFRNSGATSVKSVARWTGGEWISLGAGPSDGVVKIAAVGDALYAILITGGIERYDGTLWMPLGTGVGGPVRALAADSARVLIGGEFTVAGGLTANRVAVWDQGGGRVRPLGLGVNGPVYGAAFFEGAPVVTGLFTQTGTVMALGIARWTGSSWTQLGGGLHGLAEGGMALAARAGELFVGGDFSSAGTVPASYIARWDGSAWSPLGAGLSDGVRALVFSDDDLIAGGEFLAAGGVSASHVARWDGTAWSPLGAGTDGVVRSVATFGGDIVVGGLFSQAGGVVAQNVARWDGAAWHAMGEGLDGLVWGLAESNGRLFATGSFTSSGSVSVPYLAAWNGTEWSSLRGGLDAPSYCAQPIFGSLLVGGDLTNAGGQRSMRLARWIDTAAGVDESWPLAGGSKLRFEAFPNPFREETSLRFDQPAAGRVTIRLFDVTGRVRGTLLDIWSEPGPHETRWDARSGDGALLGPGVYFVQARAGREARTIKLVRVP